MHNDDEQIGRVLSRREALGLIGVGAAALGGSTPLRASTPPRFRLPACIVRPAQTEGPYFVETELDRSDIRSDPNEGTVSDGTPLSLHFRVSRLNAEGCQPLVGALVDVWHCDALGIYSGVEDINDQFDTRGQRFLRGHQTTDAEGVASFRTIYPGWYQGRTVHIHFKIRTDPGSNSGHEFTSQLYFDDELTDRVLAAEPYAQKQGQRARNADDGAFRSGGRQLMLDVAEGDELEATFDVGLQID